MCINCRDRNRWDEVLYKPYLKVNPTKDGKEFVEYMKRMDNKALPCIAPEREEAPEKDWDEALDYDSAQEMAKI